jgi:hypothetical protein
MKEKAEVEKDMWATSCIFTVLNNITYLSFYRETMSSDQETLK